MQLKCTSNYNGLPYNTREKNKYKKYKNNNCYTYAINQPKNPYTNKPYESYGHCQPGNLGDRGYDAGYSIRCSEKSIKLAKEDLEKIGYELIESSFEEFIENEECWKVAFCCYYGDYHWYRQNEDGTWSHKIGTNPVTNKDEDNNIIYNPETCNRGRYDKFVGFYIIRKKISDLLLCVA